MNTCSQIQIHFPRPGDWGRFTLTALWSEGGPYEGRRVYRPAEIPTGAAVALQGVFASIISLGEPWACTHATAVLKEITPEREKAEGDSELEPVQPFEVVQLTIRARRDCDGMRGEFTPEHYPQLSITDEAVIAAFKLLTTQNPGDA